jgi:excisionase family DNA binding protein
MEARTALLSSPLVTAEEVATLLKVSPKSIYRWAKDGILPAFREGRLVRFLESDVETFVRDRVGVRASVVD